MVLFKIKTQVPNHAIKKNNKQIAYNKSNGRRFIISSNKAQAYEKWLTLKLKSLKMQKNLETIDQLVNVSFKFSFPKSVYYTKKNEISKRLPDMSNLYQAPEDALQKAGILENDYLIGSHDDSRRTISDDNNYYLEIIISDFQD